jgi:hypothetical protein
MLPFNNVKTWRSSASSQGESRPDGLGGVHLKDPAHSEVFERSFYWELI